MFLGIAEKGCRVEAFETMFEQIREHGFIVDDDPSIEARHNLYRLAMSSAESQTMTVGQLTDFLEEARQRLARSASDSPGRLRFYAWCDEQAGQLSLCVSSAPELPFGATLRLTSDPAIVARRYLKSRTMDGIPWSDLVEVGEREELPPPVPYVLDVFAVPLNEPE